MTVHPYLKLFEEKSVELDSLCRQFHVESLFIFGSVLTSKFRPDSDLDFVVTFRNVPLEEYADNFFDFRDALEALFQRKIDLVESQTIKNPYFKKAVESSKIQLYGRRQSRQMVV
jgi:uncharacterized protein